MPDEAAETRHLQPLLARVGAALDEFVEFKHPDALHPGHTWRERLDLPLPYIGVGIDQVTDELIQDIIPNGSATTRPGFSSFVTTGGTTAAALAATAANVAAPQRYWMTAFNLLEEVSLKWLATMCGIGKMQGVFSSGGSTANLLALGAARQFAFEEIGHDVAAEGAIDVSVFTPRPKPTTPFSGLLGCWESVAALCGPLPATIRVAWT